MMKSGLNHQPGDDGVCMGGGGQGEEGEGRGQYRRSCCDSVNERVATPPHGNVQHLCVQGHAAYFELCANPAWKAVIQVGSWYDGGQGGRRDMGFFNEPNALTTTR
jgi:hypothetical protein